MYWDWSSFSEISIKKKNGYDDKIECHKKYPKLNSVRMNSFKNVASCLLDMAGADSIIILASIY